MHPISDLQIQRADRTIGIQEGTMDSALPAGWSPPQHLRTADLPHQGEKCDFPGRID